MISSTNEEQKIAIGAWWSELLSHIMEEKFLGKILSLSLPMAIPPALQGVIKHKSWNAVEVFCLRSLCENVSIHGFEEDWG